MRHLTPEQIDHNDTQEQEAYMRFEAEVQDELRAEWQAQFGGNPKFPFNPDGRNIHRRAMARLAAQ